MKYKIMVLDLDGTLTNSKKKITPYTKKALMKAQRQGVTVVLASGRPTTGITYLAQELLLSQYNGYILSYNGGKIINCKTGETIYNKTLPEEIVPQVYNEAVKNKVSVMTYKDDAILVGNGIDKYCEIEAQINNIPLCEVDDFDDNVDFDVNKCLFTGDGEYLERVEQRMKKRFNSLSIYRSAPFFLEIMPKNIDKANSLKKMLSYLNCSREEMICCGDGFNDLSMIEYAGLGVAMDNAQDCVKEAADYITFSNDNDGVAHVIEKFIL